MTSASSDPANQPITDRVVIRRALISVSDKDGLIDRARQLIALGVELISTGGTYQALRDADIAVREVFEVTQFPEMMDGRVKTLHPKIHGGILARRDEPSHLRAMAQAQIEPIDLVIVNLYPFEATIQRGASFAEAIENIDIGGPSLLRGAAKNADFVAVCVDFEDLDLVLAEMAAGERATSLALRRELALRVFARCAAYDSLIADYMAQNLRIQAESRGPEKRIGPRPKFQTFGGERVLDLRYGENPHQTAALYRLGAPRPGVVSARLIQGKPLSYNNIQDLDAAFELVCELAGVSSVGVAIIKHANPCGAALAADVERAYRRAFDADPVSAFGGIIACSHMIDAAGAKIITEIFTEAVIAPDASPEAIEIFAQKRNLRLLLTGALADPGQNYPILRSVSGGFLVQDRDCSGPEDGAWRVVTQRMPSDAERLDLIFAAKVAKHVKSNAIVLAKDNAIVGVGAGQMSRLDSVRIARWKAEEAARIAKFPDDKLEGCVLASDAFFPFADGVEAAIAAGAKAIIQPGGSVRDAEVIEAANRAGMAMVFTGLRHFRH